MTWNVKKVIYKKCLDEGVCVCVLKNTFCWRKSDSFQQNVIFNNKNNLKPLKSNISIEIDQNTLIKMDQ